MAYTVDRKGNPAEALGSASLHGPVTFTIVLRVATRVFILKCHSGVVCVNNHMPHCCSVDCVEWCRVDCVEWCSVECVEWCSVDCVEWCSVDCVEWCGVDCVEWCSMEGYTVSTYQRQ